MHLGIPALLEFFREHRDDDALVLATIVATAGSTYRKPGAMMLIARDGAYEGLISGGCLEGDLLHHAGAVFETGRPSNVTYDMHAGDELVWNLGLGCDGVIHLLLQRLDRESQFGFLEALETAFQARQPIRLGLVSHGDPDHPTATFGMMCGDISIGSQELIEALDAFDDTPPGWRWKPLQLGDAEGPRGIAVRIPPRTRVLICGAGPDAVPMAAALAALDWEVLVADHRPAFARAERFTQGCSVLQVRPERLHTVLDPGSLDAAVIMSHHLENDAAYLAQLASAGLTYVGVLGPRARRDRLMQMASCDRKAVHGPVGLDIGAELPAAIALAVAAEIHAVLNGRDGVPLTKLTDHERDS